MCMSLSDIDCIHYFYYNVICVNNNVCGSLCVPYKYKGNVLISLSWKI